MGLLINFINLNNYFYLFIFILMISLHVITKGDWGLGIVDWGLGIGPNPQSPIPNPQSPIPNRMFHLIKFAYY